MLFKLLRKQLSGFLVAEDDFVNRLTRVLEGDVLAIDVRGKEDFYKKKKIHQ